MRAAFLSRLFLVLVLVTSTQSLLLTRGAFELRRDEITRRLCVNRDRPELNCNGSCVLSRMLHEQQERQDAHDEAVLEIALSVTPLLAATAALGVPEVADVPTPRAGPTLAWAEGAPSRVDRPPQA